MSVPFSNRTTSRAAAKVVDESGSGKTQEALVYKTIANSLIGATDDEVSSVTGLPIRQVSARRRALVLKGLVKDSLQTRRGPTGLPNIVWEKGLGLSANPEKPRKSYRDEYFDILAVATEIRTIASRSKTLIMRDANDFASWTKCMSRLAEMIDRGK